MVVSVKYSLSFPKVEILKFDPMNIPNWSCRWTKGIGVRDFRFFYQHYYSQISICTACLISSWVCLSFRNRQSTGPLIRMTYITSGPCSVLISSCNNLWVNEKQDTYIYGVNLSIKINCHKMTNNSNSK